MLLAAHRYVGRFLMTFKEYQPCEKAASYTIDEVLRKLHEGSRSK